MKKTAFIVFLCFTFVLLSNISINVYATEEIEYDVLDSETHASYLNDALSHETAYASGISTYDSFLTAYYDNLTYNLGVNYKGSCGYVAIAMFLSYYDTYLNDNIIPNQYDVSSIGDSTDILSRRNSPGVLRDIIVNPADNSDIEYAMEMSSNNYYSMVSGLSNQSLHAKLITIGAQYGFYNFNDSRNPAGTLFNERLTVINDYLTNIAGLEATEYEMYYINYENSSNYSDVVRDYAIAQIQAGNPVLLSVRGSRGGHVVVAYDYDAETDQLFCHMGWGANLTHVTPEDEGFSIYRTALAISFNESHSHTNNYGVTTITNNIPTTEYYCYDDCRLLTYKDLHSYVNNYEPYTNTQHKAYCECGKYILEEHSSRIDACTLCGEPHTHDYSDYYARETSTAHRCYCSCGASELLPHVFSSGTGGILNKKICIFCGEIIEKGLSVMTSTSQLPHTENGSFILPDGIIVLVDEDIEAYFNGTLEFIYPGDNSEAA